MQFDIVVYYSYVALQSTTRLKDKAMFLIFSKYGWLIFFSVPIATCSLDSVSMCVVIFSIKGISLFSLFSKSSDFMSSTKVKAVFHLYIKVQV